MTTTVRIACTLGDPNGIGAEVVFKALRDEALLASQPAEFIVVGPCAVLRQEFGDRAVKRRTITLAGRTILFDPIDTHVESGEPLFTVQPGVLSAGAGRLAMRSIERATDLCLSGDADAIVTAPISKEAVHLGGYDIPGHTEFLSERTQAQHVTMMLVSGRLRVAVVTGHIPVARVSESVSSEGIEAHLQTIHNGLKQDFALTNPRIAVLGLNPHAGDGGVLGGEEAAQIAPAIAHARDAGIDARGPYAADGFFGARGHEDVDCTLAMYHDQGLAPFKALSFGCGVNVTLGLPIVRTSPDHGTAFDIAGRGVARADSLKEAIRTAAVMALARRSRPAS